MGMAHCLRRGNIRVLAALFPLQQGNGDNTSAAAEESVHKSAEKSFKKTFQKNHPGLFFAKTGELCCYLSYAFLRIRFETYLNLSLSIGSVDINFSGSSDELP